ncbi:sulfatase-like hydrolase/transferase [Lentisphaera marina]|uniref:sulfatase-like hydrolase/transferase n=1 Tax=Lentisphaera marina TaxID=1111041 RepID=UPI002367025C|nr:sulfatase-like hydrolase/transferase [Lentisphaera marina]MDD7984785.1 sulfatase-like hydrolase/transferase [Lentisphaera marina]
MFAEEKTNILFIFADDQSYETIGNQTECKTPHLNRLKDSGINFTHAYNMGAWNGAVCAASRAMLNSGLFVNSAQQGIKKYPHWSELMSQAGYKTYMTGKWHVPGKPRFDVVRDPRPGMPKQTEEGYNRPLSPENYEQGWKPWDKSKGGFWEGGVHWTEIVTNHGIDFIKEAKNDKKPFFMYIAYNAPHDPRQAPKEYVDMYPLNSISVPENFLSEYPKKELIGCGPLQRDARLAPFPRTEYAVKVNRQEYFACISYMDAEIGRLLKALEDSELAENTLVIFTADHGLAVGRHGFLGKQNMYDHSVRVPFLMAGPNLPSGKTISSPIYLQDAMATSLEVAGVENAPHLQFKSVLPLINGERKVQYEKIYGEYIDHQRMITKGDWKYITYPHAQQERLFNLKKDPLEKDNLSKNPEYALLKSKLKSALKDLQKEMKDDFDIDAPPAFWDPTIKKNKKRAANTKVY